MSDPVVATGLACLSLKGADALTFLQGQLSCDMRPLVCKDGVGGISLAARLNLKGRVVASLYVLGVADGFLLLLPTSQAEALLADLKKYLLFSKATLQQEPWQVLAQVREDVAAGEVVQQGDELVAQLPQLPVALVVSPSQGELVDASTFRAAEINAGIAQISPTTAGLWLPQELGYDELGAVNYNKGCYLGQEIVARLHFKGEVKQHLYCLRLIGAAPLAPAASLQEAAGKALGQLVQVVAQEDGTQLAQAVLRASIEGEVQVDGARVRVASCAPLMAP